MKNTFTIIGAVAVALALVAAVAVFVKKYTVSFSIKKNEEAELPEEDDIYDFGDDIDWEEVPVEDDDDEFKIVTESVDELDNLDTDSSI